jgi:hypothetical protein
MCLGGKRPAVTPIASTERRLFTRSASRYQDTTPQSYGITLAIAT